MAPWEINQTSAAYLVSLDIVGFTAGEHSPENYLVARTALERAVFETKLVHKCVNEENMPIQLLGDEMRLPFLSASNSPNDIFECLEEVFEKLKNTETRVRVAIVTGPVTPIHWNHCLVLKGALAMKVQRWLSQSEVLSPGTIAVDDIFNMGLSPQMNEKGDDIHTTIGPDICYVRYVREAC